MTTLRESIDYRKVEAGLRSSARNMWLASLGLLSTVEQESVSMFDQLVERGKSLEERSKRRWRKTRREVETKTDEWTGKIDEQVSDVLQRMGVPSRSQVEDLSGRVEKLTNQVARLGQSRKRPATPRSKSQAA
jgi:polyhydroxyalkanoate synthesis regulator phasin